MKGIVKFTIFGIALMTIYNNLIYFNNLFSSHIPIGYILIFIFGILILNNIYRSLKFDYYWIKNKHDITKVLIHIGCILIVCSLILSFNIGNFLNNLNTNNFSSDNQKVGDYKFKIENIENTWSVDRSICNTDIKIKYNNIHANENEIFLFGIPTYIKIVDTRILYNDGKIIKPILTEKPTFVETQYEDEYFTLRTNSIDWSKNPVLFIDIIEVNKDIFDPTMTETVLYNGEIKFDLYKYGDDVFTNKQIIDI